jgi:excisionase family DNA binding protein
MKRTEITIETDRVVVIRGRRRSGHAYCERCDKLVEMVTVDEAASFAGVSSRSIFRWVEDGELHFIETANGHLLVCLDSIQFLNIRRKT